MHVPRHYILFCNCFLLLSQRFSHFILLQCMQRDKGLIHNHVLSGRLHVSDNFIGLAHWTFLGQGICSYLTNGIGDGK